MGAQEAFADSLRALPCADFFLSDHHVATNEVDEERWCKSDDQRCLVEGNCDRVRLENKGLLQCVEQPCDRCHQRGQEDRHFHHPRHLPHQDQGQASHQSRCEDDVWQGDQGEGKASKDRCESLRSRCTQEADLEECVVTTSHLSERLVCRGN